MPSNNYVRLRQICLAASDIKHAETVLSNVLGLEVCHRSNLPQFGLENIMYALNGVFLEIVAPTKANTAVDRFLARNKGRGGYMAIFDCADVTRHKALAHAAGVEPIYERSDEKADLLQLNPKQTGATMMEFDHHYGDDGMLGHYEWAGDGWHKFVKTDVTKDVLSIEICSPDVGARAALWGRICDRPVLDLGNNIREISLDYGTILFRDAVNGEAEQLSAMDLTVADPGKMLETAKRAGCPVSDKSFDYCGVEFRLHAGTKP
ncbi:MAG: VOC family protein [Sneathiella sp.]|nr:VOC family protein [Sneathiella sp.]